MKKTFIVVSIFLVILNAPFIFASENESSVEINQKLQKVLDSQEEILIALKEIKEELGVLKVRVSQNQ